MFKIISNYFNYLHNNNNNNDNYNKNFNGGKKIPLR